MYVCDTLGDGQPETDAVARMLIPSLKPLKDDIPEFIGNAGPVVGNGEASAIGILRDVYNNGCTNARVPDCIVEKVSNKDSNPPLPTGHDARAWLEGLHERDIALPCSRIELGDLCVYDHGQVDDLFGPCRGTRIPARQLQHLVHQPRNAINRGSRFL